MNKTLGQELINAVDEALQAPTKDKVLRSPIDVKKYAMMCIYRNVNFLSDTISSWKLNEIRDVWERYPF